MCISKKISVILFSILFSACADYKKGGNTISIVKKSDTEAAYKLVSVRDSSLVVFSATEEARIEHSFSHAEIIPFDSIRAIYRESYQGPFGRGTSARIGYAAGAAGFGTLAYIASRNYRPQKNPL